MAWLPLESNPDVMNKYLQNLGVPSKWQMVDVFGLDPELLATVPKPVLAVLLLYPINEKIEEFHKTQEAELNEKGQDITEKLFFLRQYVSNACGTVALVHSVANNTDQIELGDGDLKQYIEDGLTLSPEERGNLLMKANAIANAHKEYAQEGQTEAPDVNQPVTCHFIAFVHKDGSLYELDGRKSFPINHGPTSAETLLDDAAKVCKDYIARDPEELRFTVVALTGSE